MTDERHYCLEALGKAKDFLLSAVEKLPKLRAGYDKYKGTNEPKSHDYLIELHKITVRLKSELSSIKLSLNELEEPEIAEVAQKLITAINKFKFLEQDYTGLCAALSIFAKELPVDGSINTAVLGRLMNRVKMGHFPTDLPHVKLIKNALTFPPARVNILDPCCGCGDALQLLADGENVLTYGVELDRKRAEKAENKLDRVGYGSFFYSRLSNRSFHCVFLNPPYMFVMKEGGGSSRAERTFLLDILRYLMIGGILVYIIPYYRLTEDICALLAENFDDLQVYRFQEYEFKKFKQIVIFGRLKQREPYTQEKAAELLRLSLDPDSIIPIDEIPAGIYPLPEKELEVKQFKGAEFNVNELAVQLSKSNSLKQLFDKSKLDTMHRNPLLPLKVGQIGLIGGSGLMNGLIDCEEPHIIKGRVVKEVRTETTTDAKKGTEEIREITSNHMIFNVLTANGFKSLT
jgi:predicted RNA methylase